jgi:hypothetical protein
MSVRVEGVEDVLNNLNSEIGKIEGKTMAGLLEAGFIVQADAQRKAPIDTGNLRGSAYTRKTIDGSMSVEVGFGAAYALWVHENMDSYHPTGQAKFLESALTENSGAVLDAIARKAKI